MTSEHVWPRWFAEAMRAAGHLDYDIVEPNKKYAANTLATVTVKRVCKTCNTGWMGKIEDQVKPVALPLIMSKGGEHYLSPKDQGTIATWAVLKAMLLLEADDSITPPPLAGFDRFRLEQGPSRTSAFVWIAAYRGSSFGAWGQVYGGRIVPGIAHHYFTTMLFHRLIVQVYNTFDVEELIIEQHLPAMLRIWPPNHNTQPWPPNLTAFDDAELSFIARPPRGFHY